MQGSRPSNRLQILGSSVCKGSFASSNRAISTTSSARHPLASSGSKDGERFRNSLFGNFWKSISRGFVRFQGVASEMKPLRASRARPSSTSKSALRGGLAVGDAGSLVAPFFCAPSPPPRDAVAAVRVVASAAPARRRSPSAHSDTIASILIYRKDCFDFGPRPARRPEIAASMRMSAPPPADSPPVGSDRLHAPARRVDPDQRIRCAARRAGFGRAGALAHWLNRESPPSG
jgi:hypothetical protein